jgi:hypothetical protein
MPVLRWGPAEAPSECANKTGRMAVSDRIRDFLNDHVGCRKQMRRLPQPPLGNLRPQAQPGFLFEQALQMVRCHFQFVRKLANRLRHFSLNSLHDASQPPRMRAGNDSSTAVRPRCCELALCYWKILSWFLGPANQRQSSPQSPAAWFVDAEENILAIFFALLPFSAPCRSVGSIDMNAVRSL